jgi:threonyl-tRNA synthetase
MLGAREKENRTVTMRAYGAKEQTTLSLDQAIARFKEEGTFAF